MFLPSTLIAQTGRRLRNQRWVNIYSFFLSLMVTVLVAGYTVFTIFALSAFLVLIPLALLVTLMIRALVKAGKIEDWEAVASFLDERTEGQERFLTYATLAQERPDLPFAPLLQRQTARKASSFIPEQDLPFKMDKRVPVAVLAAALSILMLFFLPSTPVSSLLAPQIPQDQGLAHLEQVARELLKGTTLPEQAAGAQLLALAEELKNPALSPREKEQLIEEARQRLNLPLPQLLPFDLKLFANESQNAQGAGNQTDQPQSGDTPLAKSEQNSEQLKKSPSAAAGNEPHTGPTTEGEKQEQSKPREAGGGVQFNLPQPQSGEKQERAGNEPPGQQQQATQDQAPNNQGPGTDPNRPGGRQGHNQGAEKEQQASDSQQQQQQGTGTTRGGSSGERFLQPGEQPGGFLTKDAQFVKVRVPIGQDAPGGDKRTERRGGSLPKTPYSNAPLKEGSPDQPTPTQPIPLEYRAILRQ
jgi:hypothetical protein